MALTVVCEPSGKSRRTFEAVLRLFGYFAQPLQADPRIALLVVGHSEHVHLHAAVTSAMTRDACAQGSPASGRCSRRSHSLHMMPASPPNVSPTPDSTHHPLFHHQYNIAH